MNRKTGVQEYYDRLIGGKSAINQFKVVLSGQWDVVVKRRPERVGLIVSNNSSLVVTLAFKLDLVNAFSVRLSPRGGTLILDADDGELVTTSLYSAFVPLGFPVIDVLEVFRDTLEETVK